MPRIRPEQIANYGISDLQIAANAAIQQAKIANQISDPQGWISKGTINVVDSFVGTTAGYQEFGMTINGADDSGLAENTVYYFEVNGTEYSINTGGQAAPISYNTVATLMEAEITGDNLSALITGNDLRIISTVSGYDKNVFINPNCTRHRLHEYLAGFSAFEEGVKGTGISWDGSQAGRIFFAADTNETLIGISTDPYYSPLGGGGSTESKITTQEASIAVDWTGTTATTFRSDYGFSPDGSNLFVYLNGQLMEFGPGGNNDYQIAQGEGENGEYTDVIINSSYALGADDKVTMIVYLEADVSVYATKAYVNAKLSDGVELDGDTSIDGNLLPGQNAVHSIGISSNTWKDIHLNDAIYFNPIGSGDTAKIYRSVTGSDTQMKFQIGSSSNDKIIFEDENNTSILVIDGDGGCTVPGNLTVQGTTTYANTANTTITDADFVIKETTPALDGDATYSVERANGNVALKWNDSIDRWQLVYGSTANITSDILTQDDLASGKNLDARYVNQSQIVASGSTENDGAVKYAGIFNAAGVNDGVFYSGTYLPDADERLNYNGHLYVKALTADDVYVSASSLYVNGKKAIEDDNNVMTFRASEDQSMQIKTTGTEGDIDLISVDNITSISAGHLDFSISGTKTGKNISFSNSSAGGEIQLSATGSGGSIQVQAGGPTAEVVNINTLANDPTGTGRMNIDGHLYATRVYNAVYNDIAEYMEKAEDAEPGEVLVMTSEGLAPTQKRADKAVIGVYSDSFGYALGAENAEDKYPIGISGRVWVKVKEPLKIGDLLVTSSEKGFASVANEKELLIPGIKFGKVLKDKTDFSEERIPILIINC